MSRKSSSPVEWWSALEPAPAELFAGRGDPEDPRLGEVVRRWEGSGKPTFSRATLVGFCSDEGTRRNFGRPGAAQAPDAIRSFLYRLTSWAPPTKTDLFSLDLLDVGNLSVSSELETSQELLGSMIGDMLGNGVVPIILGGGHETAFAHYRGYAAAGIECGIINIDAHLDVRPFLNGAHSGSPFRQAIEHPTHPLKPGRYVVIGAQRQSCARDHVQFVQEHQGRIHWLHDVSGPQAIDVFAAELDRLSREVGAVMVTVDVDAFRQADVPGCSAPSPVGLPGEIWPEIAFRAGAHPVRSLDVVEVNPTFDRDGQTARWAAVGVRQFLVAVANRKASSVT